MSRRCTSLLMQQQHHNARCNRSTLSILILSCLAFAFLSFSPSLSPITFADAQAVSLACQFTAASSSPTGGPYIGTNATYNLYGDSGIQRRTIQCYSTIQTNIYISDVTILNQRNFINLTVPTQGSTKPITLNLVVDVSQQLAGDYPTTFVITGSPNGANPAPAETVSLALDVVVNAALNFFTNQTDPFTGTIRSGAPGNLTEGGAFSQVISLRSRPTGPVTLTIAANVLSGESWGQVGPQGQPLRGGGSLIDVSTTTLQFSQTSYSTVQRVVFSNVANNIMQGNRWTIVTFTFTSSDSFYQNLQIPPMNITILEKDWAQIVLTGAGVAAGMGTKLHLDVTPGATPPQIFTIALGAAPLDNVTMTIPSGFRYTISPNTLFFTANDYSVPRTMTITILNSNVISGTRVSLQNFTGAVSGDSDFAGLTLLPLEIAYQDPNNIMVSISPPYATWTQSATSPVQMTVSYSGSSTFLPNGIGETTLPTIACVFANTNGPNCNDPSQFFGGGSAAECDYKYAQILTTGWVISPTQITCPVPTCPSTLSTATTPGTPSAKSTECLGTYKMIVLVNGEPSTNAFTFIWLTPIGGPGSDFVPQVNSIEPGTIDVNSYVWITVHGANFALANKYPNPTGGDVGDSKVSLVNCKIGGIVAPAVDTSASELDSTGALVPMIKCLSRPRPDLAGSTNNVPVVVEVTMNGQEYTANGKTINVFDYDKKAYNNSWTYFFVAVALVGLVFAAMLLQHFLCANFFKTHTEEAESAKIRVTRGPQMLIDLLEPQVREQTAQVKELEKQEALEAAAAGALLAENEDLVKARIAELQREAAARKEEKKRLKAEKKAQKEANKIADAARQEVLAAAGLTSEISSAGSDSESGAESEREERKRKKREKKEKKEAKKAAKAAEALMQGESPDMKDERKEQGIELANLSGDQLEHILASPSEEPMTPHDGGAESDAGSEKSTSRKSSKKKKHKESKKKKKKHSRSDKAPLDMNEYKHQQQEVSVASAGEAELSAHSDGGASDAGGSKKKKKKKDGKKSKKKKNKVGDDSDAAPSDAEFMGASSAAASEADEDGAASEASASHKKKKKKSSSKKDKKEGKSSKKKKKKAEEE